jgi:hypothetical protein
MSISLQNYFHPLIYIFNYFRDKCKIGPRSWPKLRITPCNITNNLYVLIIGLHYKSFHLI